MPLDGVIIDNKPITENDYWAYDLSEKVETEPAPEAELEVTPEPEVEEEPTPEVEPEPEVVPEPAIAEERPKKRYISLEDEKLAYDLLEKKYGHERLKPEEKAIAFIRSKNPGLDENEIMFIAESEYGIGVEPPAEDDLTDAQSLELKKQAIARKRLIHDAQEFFQSEASQVQIDGTDPLDLDENYKAYQTERQAAQARQVQEQANYQNTIKEITSATKKISDLKLPVEIDIDDSKLAVDVNFKLDDKKQAELIKYAERYTPSEDEVKQFTDTTTGKFDFVGYMGELANRVYAKDIIKAGIRQALAKDRQDFIDKNLKNSTLRNNEVSETANRKVDANDAYWNAREAQEKRERTASY